MANPENEIRSPGYSQRHRQTGRASTKPVLENRSVADHNDHSNIGCKQGNRCHPVFTDITVDLQMAEVCQEQILHVFE
jgi:hypothetical protein